MWKTIVVVGMSAVIIGGAGTVALAASESTTSTAAASSASSASESRANEPPTRPGRHEVVDRLRRSVHATWVTENKKTKTFTTHNAIRGQVTAVSATSITVKSADSVTETYVVNSGTKVSVRATKAAGAISDVKTGEQVFVAGTGADTLTATRVVDVTK